MDERTAKALDESIAKWRRNALAEKPEEYLTAASDCPLCALFFEEDCDGCPVRERTGFIECAGTPYRRAAFAHDTWQSSPMNTALRDAARAAAVKEADFLASLRDGSE